jgi:hypothetical protein
MLDLGIAPFHILLVVFLLIVVTLFIRASVRDARRRGKSPLLVCLLVLLYFPLGFITWLLFRPEPKDDPSQPFALEDYRVQ